MTRLLRAGRRGIGGDAGGLSPSWRCSCRWGTSMPRIASLPALVVGGVVTSSGIGHFAFRASAGSLIRQAGLYAVVEILALAFNGLLYDFILRTIPGAPRAYVLVRLLTSHLVFWPGVTRFGASFFVLQRAGGSSFALPHREAHRS